MIQLLRRRRFHGSLLLDAQFVLLKTVAEAGENLLWAAMLIAARGNLHQRRVVWLLSAMMKCRYKLEQDTLPVLHVGCLERRVYAKEPLESNVATLTSSRFS